MVIWINLEDDTPREVAAKMAQQRALDAERQGRINADLDRYFNRRLEELQRARRDPRRKTRIEEDPATLELYRLGLKLKRENPRMTWDQIAARISISRSQWFRWRKVLRENATIRD